MDTKLGKWFTLSACLIVTSCATSEMVKDVKQNLYHRFDELRKAGKLPGLAPDERGQAVFQGPAPSRDPYPFSVNISVTPKTDPARYTYVFTKESRSSEWHLTGAWREDPNGQREELRVE
jgi:hypothetical protein